MLEGPPFHNKRNRANSVSVMFLGFNVMRPVLLKQFA
jgi:hypothetical protein